MTTKVQFETSIEALSNGSAIYTYEGRYRGGHRSKRPLKSIQEIRRLLWECFDCDFDNVAQQTVITIVCSPQAFVKWQIARNDIGCVNTFRNLNVKLIEIKETSKPQTIFYSQR